MVFLPRSGVQCWKRSNSSISRSVPINNLDPARKVTLEPIVVAAGALTGVVVVVGVLSTVHTMQRLEHKKRVAIRAAVSNVAAIANALRSETVLLQCL